MPKGNIKYPSTPRNIWSYNDTLCMLQIFKEKEETHRRSGRKYRNKEMFVVVEREMSQLGIYKTAKQIRIKWKHLKSAYFCTKRNNNMAGAGAVKTVCPFSDILEDILDISPSTAVFTEAEMDLSYQEGQVEVSCGAEDLLPASSVEFAPLPLKVEISCDNIPKLEPSESYPEDMPSHLEPGCLARQLAVEYLPTGRAVPEFLPPKMSPEASSGPSLVGRDSPQMLDEAEVVPEPLPMKRGRPKSQNKGGKGSYGKALQHFSEECRANSDHILERMMQNERALIRYQMDLQTHVEFELAKEMAAKHEAILNSAVDRFFQGMQSMFHGTNSNSDTH